MEEVWGEVDHVLNYPRKTKSVACAEQLKVLARVTSSATRLVDSIFITIDDHLRSSAASVPNVESTGRTATQKPEDRRRRHNFSCRQKANVHKAN